MRLNQGRVLLGAFSDLERAVEFVGRVSTTAEDVVRARWPDARRAFVDAPVIHPEPARRAFVNAPVIHPEPAPPLDENVRAEVEEVLRAPLFASSLATKRWRIEAIAVDALAVAQPLVNLTRVETISTCVRARWTMNVGWCFATVITASPRRGA